jgi:hypothetical protein
MTKLTLSMDEEVIASAKRIARRHKQSVSSMLSNMVKAMAAQEAQQETDVPPDSVTARLTGIVEAPPNKSDRELIAEALMERYGVRQ